MRKESRLFGAGAKERLAFWALRALRSAECLTCCLPIWTISNREIGVASFFAYDIIYTKHYISKVLCDISVSHSKFSSGIQFKRNLDAFIQIQRSREILSGRNA